MCGQQRNDLGSVQEVDRVCDKDRSFFKQEAGRRKVVGGRGDRCKFNNSCTVFEASQVGYCKVCRWKKCLDEGMKPELVNAGRQRVSPQWVKVCVKSNVLFLKSKIQI